MYNNQYTRSGYSFATPTYTRVTTRTSTSVITLDELKAQLNLFGETQFDTYLNRILIAGQEVVENYIGEYLSSTTIVAYYPRFHDRLSLPQQFVSAITSVAFTDDAGMSQTIASSRYLLDSSNNPPVVALRRSQFDGWTTSSLNTDIDNPIRVTYTAGIPDIGVFDEAIRHAVILICSSMFRDRENYTLGSIPRHLPLSAERILLPLKRRAV